MAFKGTVYVRLMNGIMVDSYSGGQQMVIQEKAPAAAEEDVPPAEDNADSPRQRRWRTRQQQASGSAWKEGLPVPLPGED